MATSTVTIDKAYFETLLRRAQFHTTDHESATSSFVPIVMIQKSEHDGLLITARQYANLRRNLCRGGITDETLTILTQDDTATDNTTLTVEEGATEDGPFKTQTRQSIPSYQGVGNTRQHYAAGGGSSYAPRDLHRRDNDTFQSYSLGNGECVYTPDGPSDGAYYRESGNNEALSTHPRQQYNKFAKRTILIDNLPDGTTLSDIVDAVRGGLLLDIYLRPYDRTASVSFLEEAHANEFFRYAKRTDLYIRGKRVMIRWCDHHFILPGYVANKISIGATRNLVIRKRNPKHTEEAIREDLEHIHNLVIIKVTFNGSDVHISTNSVHNALFARTCMMSRVKYKGCKIDWDKDECTAPLESRQQALKFNVVPKKTAGASQMNRFQLLNIDGADDNSQEGANRDLKASAVDSSMATSAVGVVS